MRRKFTFYAYGSDVEDIIDEVISLDAVFVRRRLNTPTPQLLPVAEVTPGSHLLIAPKVLIGELAPRDPDGSGVWVLNEGQDPLVEVIISRISGNALHYGRLYFLPQSVNPRMRLIDKPEPVQVLANELFAWARKWTKRAGGHQCGPMAAQAVRTGEILLAPPFYRPDDR
jgi:hypothetical protein